MNAEKGGRITFVPLNRVKSTPVEYPAANDAIPLIKKLQFDVAFQTVFEQVSGSNETWAFINLTLHVFFLSCSPVPSFAPV